MTDSGEKIISLYSRGLTQNEIKGHLEEIYGVDISSSLISTETFAVLDEVRAWQSRPLDAVYPILYLDALQVKVKSQGSACEQSDLSRVRCHDVRLERSLRHVGGRNGRLARSGCRSSPN